MNELLVFLHIFFMAILLFGIGLTNYASIKLHRTTDVREFGTYMSMAKTGGMMSPIAAVLLSIFGVWAASEIGYNMTDGWLVAAYITIALALVVPVFTLKPWGEKAGKMMPEALSKGSILPEQKALVTSPRYIAVELFMNGLLVFILVDMVFKPF